MIMVILFTGVGYILNVTTPTTSPKLANLKSLTQPAVNPVWPVYGSGAIGAVGFDGILAQYGDKSSLPIASITKIITTLVVLQAKPLTGNEDGPSIKITQADLDIYNKAVSAGAAVKPVTVGSSMTERQMIEAMLLPSAANYSETLAIWAYGSVDAYLKAADNWLVSNNLIQTKVVDTSGLLPENISNTGDLISLSKLAIKNSALSSIVSKKNVNIPGVGEVSNSNSLLGVQGINGIKTGTTYEAGACVLFSSIINVSGEKITVVGVLLGADDRGQQNNDVKELLKSIQPGFKSVTLASKGQEFASYSTGWGQSAKLVSTKDVKALVWSNTLISETIQADKIMTVKSGAQKGEVMIKVGNKIIQQPLLTSSSIDNPSIFWRLSHLNQ